MRSTYIRLGLLPYTTVAVSTRPPTGSSSARRRCSPQGQSSGSGVAALAENFLTAGGWGGRWAHWVAWCGGGQVAAAVAVGRGWLRLCCVSCCSSTSGLLMSLLCRSLTWVRPVLGQGDDMPVVATTGAWRCRKCSSSGCGRPCICSDVGSRAQRRSLRFSNCAGRRHLCRDAEAVSLVLLRKPLRFSSCSTLRR